MTKGKADLQFKRGSGWFNALIDVVLWDWLPCWSEVTFTCMAKSLNPSPTPTALAKKKKVKKGENQHP